MKTGPEMRGKTSVQLTLSFLLIAVLCLEAKLLAVYLPKPSLTWEDARLHCQKRFTDMVNWNVWSLHTLAITVRSSGLDFIWIGVRRDPQQQSVWKGLNSKTGEGISGDDLSQLSHWADGEQSEVCAFVNTTLMWHSKPCTSKNHFYCTNGDTIQHYEFPLSWYEALEYCRENASDLATITLSNSKNLSRGGWIGLYGTAGNNWSWTDNSTSTYSNWAPGEPLAEDCVILNAVNEKWYSVDCHLKHHFFCAKDKLAIVNESKTWEDALKHCREMNASCLDAQGHKTHCYDLLSLKGPSDYEYVKEKIDKATTDEVWTGLCFLGREWWWLNGMRPQDQEMLPDCPSQREQCGAISKYVPDRSIVMDCSERRNFICQRNKLKMSEV